MHFQVHFLILVFIFNGFVVGGNCYGSEDETVLENIVSENEKQVLEKINRCEYPYNEEDWKPLQRLLRRNGLKINFEDLIKAHLCPIKTASLIAEFDRVSRSVSLKEKILIGSLFNATALWIGMIVDFLAYDTYGPSISRTVIIFTSLLVFFNFMAWVFRKIFYRDYLRKMQKIVPYLLEVEKNNPFLAEYEPFVSIPQDFRAFMVPDPQP